MPTCHLCRSHPATRIYETDDGDPVLACPACAELLDRRDPDALVARAARERGAPTVDVLDELRELLLRAWGTEGE